MIEYSLANNGDDTNLVAIDIVIPKSLVRLDLLQIGHGTLKLEMSVAKTMQRMNTL